MSTHTSIVRLIGLLGICAAVVLIAVVLQHQPSKSIARAMYGLAAALAAAAVVLQVL